MKKAVCLMCFLFLVLGLVGCTAKDKQFTGVGLKVTLNSDFKETEIIGAQLALQSTAHLFIANRESKSDVSVYGIYTLSEYYDAVLATKNYVSEQNEFKTEDDEIQFIYGYYEAEVDSIKYGYMLIVLEGKFFYYAANFACFQKNLEKNKETYLNWAKTIEIQ